MLEFYMKRLCVLTALLLMFSVIFAPGVLAEVLPYSDYEINNFDSEINLNQDSSLTIKENIEVNFFIPKHGIFRIIPYVYTHNGKTINSQIGIWGIRDENGNKVPYTVTNFNQSKKIQIGDANVTLSGIKKYVIEYNVKNVVLDYGKGPEIYWNVTGSEWDSPIAKSSAKVKSPFGNIIKTECFGCISSFSGNEANFEGEDGLTIVAQIDKNNSLTVPGIWEKIWNIIINNWGYLLSLIPLIVIFIAWYKKGRDKKYLTENVFYQPDNKTEKDVPLFNRPHLPLVYSPINGLSPSEVGTIVDEKVDTKDIVAEIVELARLGYLVIKKIEVKYIFGIKDNDYELTKIEKSTENLNIFQLNLIDSLFDDKTTVKVSDLKNHFYTHLKSLKSDLYDDLTDKKIADNNFNEVKNNWVTGLIFLNMAMFFVIIFAFVAQTANFGPIIVLILGIIPTIILALNMPRKTAWGYSLHRQAVGLKYYLSKGKWREEIAEKNLFLEEMLPLAIALGVVKQLAADMKELEIEPPKYFEGMVMNSFVNDLSRFNSSMASGLVSAPTNYSGSGSWSGGSGFSGGGGGGFGGGGGGSW